MISINNNSKNNQESRETFLKSNKVFKTNKPKKSENLNNIKNTEKNLIIYPLKTQKYDEYFEEFFADSPDEMEFDDAIKLDKRTFCQYFGDTLKNNQIISNTFCAKDALKPREMKIVIFLLNILFYFVINALFINDDYISQVYYLEEKEKFFSFVPRSLDRFIYTTFSGIIIEFLVDFFFIEDNKLKRIFLREKDNKLVLQEQVILLINSVKNRCIAFNITLIFIYIICSYYLVCFNSIYPKIQMEWIKSSIFIFLIRQILSILQCLLEAILRFISFKCESERIFKISKLVN